MSDGIFKTYLLLYDGLRVLCACMKNNYGLPHKRFLSVFLVCLIVNKKEKCLGETKMCFHLPMLFY